MLKIKDNVDLKELEKYGFEEEKYDYFLENNVCMVEISKKNKEIFIWDDYEGTKFDGGLNILYDLIKDGLVEKKAYCDGYYDGYHAKEKELKQGDKNAN